MRTKLMKWSAFRPQLTQKVSFSQLLKKSGSEAVKKGERSVNQIENKGEGMHLMGNGIIYHSFHDEQHRTFVAKCAF